MLAKLGVQGIDPNLATLVRTLVVAVVLSLLLAATGKLTWSQLASLAPAGLGALVLSGLATGASWLCFFQALQVGPVSQVAAIDKLSVVLVAILGVTLLGEELSLQGCLGIVLMGGGAMLLAWR